MCQSFIIIAVTQILAYSMAYSVTCPEKSHWQILSKYICTHARNYTCLLDILTLENRQNCRGPKIIAPGSKYVWQPNFNRGECDAERYQPFIFHTDGYTNCSFFKSRCYSEGQVTFSNGSAKMDRSCYCDSTRGYVFVSSTHDKYCIPSEEDCSCRKNVTEGITNIYNTDLHRVDEHDETTDHQSEQSRVIYSVHAVRDYDDFRYNIKRNENARNEAARLVLIMFILMFFISYPSAVILTKAWQRLQMTTCVQSCTIGYKVEDDMCVPCSLDTYADQCLLQCTCYRYQRMELQLHVCDNEYKSFQNGHLRDLWPAVGAYCNIEECGKNQFFRSFNEYKSHFGGVHKEKLTLYTCQICDLSRRKLQVLKKHLVKDHKCSEDRYRCIEVANKNFIDPKDVLPYRVGDVKEREEAKQLREKVEERKGKAKEEAQETRKQYVEKGKKTKLEDKYYNSRDEHLKFNFAKNTLTRTIIKAKKH